MWQANTDVDISMEYFGRKVFKDDGSFTQGILGGEAAGQHGLCVIQRLVRIVDGRALVFVQ